MHYHAPTERPTDWVITDSFIAKKRGTILMCGPEATGDFSRNYMVQTGSYTPRLFRRKRLQRFAPLARDLHSTRLFWRWLQHL